MQIKYGFKKEWLQFTRTFRLGGIILAIFSFALADPLMYKMLDVMMSMMSEQSVTGLTEAAAGLFCAAAVGGNIEGYEAIGEYTELFGSASTIFSATLAELCSTSVLIVMLILMSPSGGEQKKRETIIPSCCGLDYFSYLVPKFVLYPLTVFAVTFLSALTAGGLCDALFDSDKISGGMVVLAAFMCAVYVTFIITVYMSIGLCTSRPGIITVLVYLGSTLIELILTSLDMTKFHPFTLRALVSGEMFYEDFVLSENVASIAVGVLLSLVISAVMFALALAVLKATKINNREDKPEF